MKVPANSIIEEICYTRHICNLECRGCEFYGEICDKYQEIKHASPHENYDVRKMYCRTKEE